MYLEDQLIAWFAAHPFLRTLALLTVGTLSAYAKKDWDKYKADKEINPARTFNWAVAGKQYLEAVIMAVLPAVFAKIWTILGGT